MFLIFLLAFQHDVKYNELYLFQWRGQHNLQSTVCITPQMLLRKPRTARLFAFSTILFNPYAHKIQCRPAYASQIATCSTLRSFLL